MIITAKGFMKQLKAYTDNHMNIGILVYDIGLTGGAEKVAEKLAIQLGEYHNVTLITLFDSLNVCEGKDYRTAVLSKQTKSITRSFLSLKNKLQYEIKTADIDIIIAITAGVVTLAVASAKETGTRVIYAEHSNLENKTYGKKHQLRQLLGAKFSDAVATLTERDRDNFIKEFKINPEKVVSIPNWYDPNKDVSEYRGESKSIITVGRLETVKGYNYLIQVAEIIADSCKGWKWDIYGDGSLHEKLQEEILSKGLDSFVCLKGNSNNLSEIYPEYAFFVMTSVYEGFPLVLLEAQAASLPIISFNCPTGPAEIIDDGINGTIIPAYDVPKLAEAVLKMINDSDMRCRYASRARKNLTRYSMESVLKKWLRLIETVAGEQK